MLAWGTHFRAAARVGLLGFAAGADGGGERGEERVGFGPVDAGVGDALAVYEGLAGNEFLRAGDQVALDHDADDVVISGGDLRGNIFAHDRLAAIVFLAVGVTEVDHDAGRDAGALEEGGGFSNAGSSVVDGVAAAAQDDVAIGIAGGDEDGRLAVMGVAEKSVRVRCREHGVDGDLHIAGGSVLEPHGTGKAGDELTMDLAFGGAGADGSPTDKTGDVLRRDHVEEFGAGGHAHFGEIEKEMAREAKAVVDFERAVEMGIVDEAFPADGGAGLFEVDAHDDAEIGGEFIDGGSEMRGVFARGFDIVNGAGAGEDDEAVVLAVKDGDDFLAAVEDGGGRGVGDGEFFLEKDGRENDLRPLDTNIFSGVEHGLISGRAECSRRVQGA